MILLISRQSHFTATLQSLHLRGYPFSRSYGVMLPNSLTKVLPFALVYSTHLPVSDCGTGIWKSMLRGFSRQQGSTTYASRARYRLSSTCGFSYRPQHLNGSHQHNQSLAGLPRCVPSSLLPDGSGMLTGCPSPTPLGLG